MSLMCHACPQYAAAGFTVCAICGAAVASTRGKPSRKPSTRAKTPDWNTTSRKPRPRKGDGSLQAKAKPAAPKMVLAPLKVEIAPLIVGINSILRDLASEGMDTNSKIAEGLRTGRVVQAISYEKNYQKVIDYLIAEGYNVGKHRFYIVCGGIAA